MSQPKVADVKKPAAPQQPSALGKLLRAHARRLFLATIVCSAAAAGAYAIWRSVAHDVLHHDQFRLTLDQLTVTPQPAWLHTRDVRSEVFRDGGFANNVWLHDPTLAEQIAKTFELHPWVAKVERVKLRGARVDVELAYRRPVCMVEVPGGVFPVDIEGTLLPRDDFTPAEARRYPRLSGVTSVPAGLAPMPWGDLHVVGGAEIAAALADCWEELRLDHIGVIATGTADILFELVVRSGTSHAGDKIIWGHAPSTREPSEPTTEQKLAQLKSFLGEPAVSGSPASGRREIDLRRARSERTAMNPQQSGSATE